MTISDEGRWAYRPALDGLRAVAVVLVICFHAGTAMFSGGFVGVDLFFVLSGFLVTSVMLAEHARTGRIRLGRFYARRVRRLLPAALVLVVGVAADTLLVQTSYTRHQIVPDARASLLYTANWHFLGNATEYFAGDIHASPFLHFWSLAIEEQFYAVYPLALIGLFALRRRLGRRSVLTVGVAFGLLVSLGLQLGTAATDPLHAYYGTETRLYQLFAGALLALLMPAGGRVRAALAWRPGAARMAPSAGGLVAAFGLAGLLLVGSGAVTMAASGRGLLATVAAVSLVAGADGAPGSATVWLLSRRGMVGLGRISYGVYLWHWPVIVLARTVIDPAPWPMAVLAGVLAAALASLSFHAVEMPIRTSHRFDVRPWSVALAGVGCSVLVALVAVAPILDVDTRPALATRGAPLLVGDADPALVAALEAPVPQDARLDVAAAAFDLGACRAESQEGCTLRHGGGLHVLVIGDSNAQEMIPAFLDLAEQEDFTLSAAVLHGCPWQQGLLWTTPNDALLRQCRDVRPSWYRQIIPDLHPDVIVTVNVPRDPEVGGSGYVSENPRDTRPVTEVVSAATSSSLDALTATGAKVVMIEPLVYGADNPADCLAGAATVGECAWTVPAEVQPSTAAYRAAAAARSDVDSVAVLDIACPFGPVCVPFLEGALVFRDGHHVYAEWWQAHLVELWDRLRATAGFAPADAAGG